MKYFCGLNIKEVDGNIEFYDFIVEYLPDDLPKKINGYFNIQHKRLKSLKGCPQIIKNSCAIVGNRLKNFIGGPEYVGVNFYCNGNSELESYEGLPKKIEGDFIYSCDNKFIKQFKNEESFEKYIRQRCEVGGKFTLVGKFK